MDELKRPFPYCSLAELGETLAESRRERQLSLDDISTMTCIRNNFLEDIESGDFSRFASWVYARGFVRTYLNLMNRMELWPYYDRFLSDNPPTLEEMGIAAPLPPVEEEFLSEEVIEEAPEPEVPLAETPTVSIEELPAAPEQVELSVEEPVKMADEPLTVKIHIPEPSVQPEEPEELPVEEEEELASLVSEEELPPESLVDEPLRVEKPTTKVRQQQQQPDSITVKLPPMPRRGERSSAYIPRGAESSNKADTPLLMNALTRRSPSTSRNRRGRSSGLILLLLSLALVGGLVTFWLRRGSVSDEMERMRQQQAEVQRLAEEAARKEEAQASTGMGADVVDVAPEAETVNATPVVDPAVPETVAAPETVQPQPAPETLVIKATGECWLEVTQGGKKLFAGILKDGDEKTFPLTQELRVVYGAPQSVTVTVNGEDRGTPGKGVMRFIYKPDGTTTPFKR